MSWWIHLENEKEEIIDTDEVRCEGGTQVFGGSSTAELNVTYNYSNYFDFKILEGMSAEKSIPLLKNKIHELGDDTDEDYWKSTEGNVKTALNILLDFAEFAVKKGIVSKFSVN